MCADAKTLRVDRPERLGSPGAAAVSVKSISVRVLQHSVGKEQKGESVCVRKVNLKSPHGTFTLKLLQFFIEMVEVKNT